MMSTETAQFSLSDKPRITVLALESSADDSCAAVVDSDRNVLSNIVIKQHQVNAEWGGIHPREAQYAHMANMVSRAPLTILDGVLRLVSFSP